MGKQDLKGEQLLGELTGKQRQVLDLLIEHKTSKEIARELGISPHTVDQRIQFAKDKLGMRSRSETAVAYRRLLEACEQMTYESSGIAPPALPADGPAQGGDAAREPSSSGARRNLFEGQHGALVRIGAIVAIAVLLVLLVLGALATFSQLSQLMAH